MTTLVPAKDERQVTTTMSNLDLGEQDDQVHTLAWDSLRSRISELDALIASLTAERQRLQAESDAIVYPVLSLPPEVTTEIFLCCLPAIQIHGRPSQKLHYCWGKSVVNGARSLSIHQLYGNAYSSRTRSPWSSSMYGYLVPEISLYPSTARMLLRRAP
ncbi:hypothetical protein B0H19DRAFT_1383782 [Mycena capillaripes]|nr:hypothetical protein B0H19DRAFT_1383713 [Mycena capillaripes]KAJ6533172.1 hypothetical protein B0H19DRAFT_1383782 [Mycena capillaripes]